MSCSVFPVLGGRENDMEAAEKLAFLTPSGLTR
jgi:hypothetical protein